MVPSPSQPTAITDLPDDCLRLIAQLVLPPSDGGSAADACRAQRQWVALAGTCGRLRRVMAATVPLRAWLPVCHPDFGGKLQFLLHGSSCSGIDAGGGGAAEAGSGHKARSEAAAASEAELESLTLQVDRTAWLTDQELLRVRANMAAVDDGGWASSSSLSSSPPASSSSLSPPSLSAHGGGRGGRLRRVRHLSVISLCRTLRLSCINFIPEAFPGLTSLHVPIPMGGVARAAEALHQSALRGRLLRLRLDVKPGPPPAATDNVWMDLPALGSLELAYDYKDELEYSPCLRLDLRGCTSLQSLAISAQHKPANLLALYLPSSATPSCSYPPSCRVLATPGSNAGGAISGSGGGANNGSGGGANSGSGADSSGGGLSGGSGLRRVLIAAEPMSGPCCAALLPGGAAGEGGGFRGDLLLKLGPEAAREFNEASRREGASYEAALSSLSYSPSPYGGDGGGGGGGGAASCLHQQQRRQRQRERHPPVLRSLELKASTLPAAWVEQGLWLPPAEAVHVAYAGDEDDPVAVRGLAPLLVRGALRELWLTLARLSNAAEVVAAVEAASSSPSSAPLPTRPGPGARSGAGGSGGGNGVGGGGGDGSGWCPRRYGLVASGVPRGSGRPRALLHVFLRQQQPQRASTSAAALA